MRLWLLVPFILAGCGESPPPSASDSSVERVGPRPPAPSAEDKAMEPHASAVEKRAVGVRGKLRALLDQPSDPMDGGPFLIITAAGTDKFVQFVGGRGESLVFDLPAVALSADELGRAARLLPAHGVRPPEGGDAAAFTLDLGQDVEAGVRLVEVVLLEVYGLEASTTVEFQGL